MRRRAFSLLILSLFILSFAVWAAQADDAASAAENSKTGGRASLFFDLVGTHNPLGIEAYLGGDYRYVFEYNKEYDEPESYLEGGAYLGYCPAYLMPVAYVDWQPVIFAMFHFEYAFFDYLGAWQSLLSFSSGHAAFGDQQFEQREGEEKTGTGHRLMVQPNLYAAVGPVYITNQTDAAYYLFSGKGPFFYEQEYDTLMRKGDWVIDERLMVLVELWKGRGEETFQIGPYYEISKSVAADLIRQRVGGAYNGVAAESWGRLARPRFYGAAGVNLTDPNRKNQFWAVVGLGGDFDF